MFYAGRRNSGYVLLGVAVFGASKGGSSVNGPMGRIPPLSVVFAIAVVARFVRINLPEWHPVIRKFLGFGNAGRRFTSAR